MKTRLLISVLVGMFILVAGAGNTWAQATAQISGTVKDQSGAVLPGVEVMATQTDTGIARSAVTNETGSFVLPNLAIGPYRLEAALPGFRTFAQTGIVLQVGSNPVVNPVLEVGQVSESVEVEANASLVETRNAGVGQVVENTRVVELPLNGRQIVDLIPLSGGATPAPLVTGTNRDAFATASFSVAGGFNTGLGYTLDGAYHNNIHDNGYVVLPFPDALQEFKLSTSATGAQNGFASAGSVSLVTKSGTNDVHGDAFEFVRNGIFNARNAFALRRDTIKRNQFGGTLGGSVIKNKLFVFGGYQATRLRQDPLQTTAFVPTAAMMAGDFTAFASPACNAGRQINLAVPFVNNRINPTLFSKPALNLQAKLPISADPCGRVIFGNPVQTNEHQGIARLDYQKSGNNSIFVRYLVDSLVTPSPFDINHQTLSVTTGVDALAQAFTVGDTYLLGPNVVNAFRLLANKVSDGRFEPNAMATAGLGAVDLGVNAFSYGPHTSNMSVTGGFTLNSYGGPNRNAIFGGNDDLSVVRGNHQMGFGAQSVLWWENNYSGQYWLQFTFTGTTTGLGMADFLTGNAATLVDGPGSNKFRHAARYGTYANDTWKLNSKWTMSYGLRWEPYLPINDKKGIGGTQFSHDAFVNGTKSSQFDNTPPGLFFAGDPGFPLPEGINKKWLNLSPRLGLAWDVKGDGRTSVRIGAGTFYDYPNANYYFVSNAPPWLPRYNVTNVDYQNPWKNFPGGDPFPAPYGPDVTRTAPWPLHGYVNVDNPDSPNMQVAQWNLSIQKQVGQDFLISATYLGNHSTHMSMKRQYNAPVFLGTQPCTLNGVQYPVCSTTANQEARRRLTLENPNVGQYYGSMLQMDTGGTAGYNGLIVGIQSRAAHGVTLNANYTWSHCISDPGGQSLAVTVSGLDSYTDPNNRRFDRGNCTIAGTDRRQVFNLSAVASTPQFSNPTLRVVGSGWRFSPIVKVISGDYFSVTTNLDRALTTVPAQRVNQVLQNPYGNKTASNYLNPAAFSSPALGTLGNVGAGSIRGPGTWTFDASLSRSFQLRESQKLEFRAEAFNVINGVRLNDPTVNFNSNTFGQVLSAQDPRIMQFALKYIF